MLSYNSHVHAEKHKTDHLFSSSPSVVTIQGLTMIAHYQKQSVLMGATRFGQTSQCVNNTL
jgi:hypothetical protein